MTPLLPGRREAAEADDVAACADCGWGKVLFARTFPDHPVLLDALLAELPGARDIAYHVTDPHVLVAQAPQDLFLDPSHTYRSR